MRNFDVIQDEASGKVIKHWTRGVEFEEEAQAQLRNIIRHPAVKGLAAMPDVHWGMGSTVGSVILTDRAIIPAAVGVDIGCGMMAVRTSLVASQLPDALDGVRSAIEAAVPHGRTDNGGYNDKGRHQGAMPEGVIATWMASLEFDYKAITDKHPMAGHKSGPGHLGTLGGGNHFIEVCLDESQAVWFMLHSGSRGPGNKIGSYFIDLAKKDMKTWLINLPDENLAYLPEGTEHFHDYMKALSWAQKYARLNREVMMGAVIKAARGCLGLDFTADSLAINCHHNYTNKENHGGKNLYVTRKGAVRARAGDLGIIPGSMGARSYIVRGLGSEDSFHSCSHGAGRKMSRTKAQKQFSLEDHAKATAGVECRKDAAVLDETPGAYKSIDAVMEAQKDLVEIVHTLKQVVCVKG